MRPFNQIENRQRSTLTFPTFTGCDVVLLSAPSFYRYPDVIVQSEQFSPRVGRLLMGDQDHEPTHAIFYLKDALRQLGIQATTVDINLLDFMRSRGYEVDVSSILSAIIQKCDPELIGISSMRPNFCEAVKLACEIRHLGYSGKIVVGGAATADRNLAWKAHFDGLLDAQNIPAVATAIVRTLPCRVTGPLPSIAHVIPDYSDVPVEVPLIPRFFMSFGCSAGCEFCLPAAIRSFKVEIPDQDRLTEYICRFNNESTFDYFLMGDLTYNLLSRANRKQLEQFSRSQIKPWWCQTQARYINRQAAAALAEAHCRQLAFAIEGFETGDFSIRKKTPNVEYTVDRLKMLADFGIERQLYWMFGLPDDTDEACAQRVDTIAEFVHRGLVEAIHLSYLMPYPGTVYGDTPKKYGLKIEKTIDQHYDEVHHDFYAPPPIHRTISMTSEQIARRFAEAKLAAKALGV